MFYKAGDTIKVKSNGFEAEILSYKDTWNHDIKAVDRTYSVVWKHLQNSGCNAFGTYTHNDVAGEWVLVPQTQMVTIAGTGQPQPVPTLKEMAQATDDLAKALELGRKSEPVGTDCSHSWKTYDSGFTKYDYCESCNEERK